MCILDLILQMVHKKFTDMKILRMVQQYLIYIQK